MFNSPIIRFIVFFVLNFGALAIGGIFTKDGVISDWYVNINKAPWTPPGWVFGAAWGTIMLCFSFYMTIAWRKVMKPASLLVLYAIQLILNIAWNPIFFSLHEVLLGLITISVLTVLVTYFLVGYRKAMGWFALFALPYAVWLFIATSLNAYVYLYN